MPAAAVIPAPIAYTKVVAVKKLVVGFRDAVIFFLGVRLGVMRGIVLCVSSALCQGCISFSLILLCVCLLAFICRRSMHLPLLGAGYLGLYFEKIRVFKAGAFFA